MALDTLIGLYTGYFSVIIRFENSSYEFPLAVEQDISGYSSSSSAWEYESYVRSDPSSEWFDLGLNWEANACIKAFTETCHVPRSPWDEFPANGAQDLPLDTILSWERVAGAESYDVYFGATYPPPLAVTTAENSYDPGTLLPGTAYFWSITARNICGEDAGYIWKFITTGTIVQHTLTINAGPGGTTDPDPGVYTKNSGDEVYIYADPNEGYDFDHWEGDVDPEEATYSWIDIVMDSDKEVTAHFEGEDPRIAISEYRLNFGGTTAGIKTSDQTFLITNSGGGILNWELYYTASWISCQPQYGTGDTLVTVSVDPSAVGPGRLYV